MKVTKSYLKQIIKEELNKLGEIHQLNENDRYANIISMQHDEKGLKALADSETDPQKKTAIEEYIRGRGNLNFFQLVVLLTGGSKPTPAAGIQPDRKGVAITDPTGEYSGRV